MLTVETGAVVPGADSYQDLTTARVDALNRGLTLSTDDDTAEQQLRQAFYWLTNEYERQLQGVRISAEQAGSFPRKDVIAYGFPVASDSVPQNVLFAQVNAAASVNGGANLNAIKTSADLKSFNVQGVYSEEYQDGASTQVLPCMPAVTQFMYPYTKAGANAFANSGGLYREEHVVVGI